MSGAPFDVKFISFDDIRENPDILKDIDVILNVGDAYTAYSGGENWAWDRRASSHSRKPPLSGRWIRKYSLRPMISERTEVLWSSHDEDNLHRWFSENYNVEVHAYVKNGKYSVVNNTYEPQDTVI